MDIYGDVEAMHGDSSAMSEKEDRLRSMVQQLGSMLEHASSGMQGKGRVALQRAGLLQEDRKRSGRLLRRRSTRGGERDGAAKQQDESRQILALGDVALFARLIEAPLTRGFCF